MKVPRPPRNAPGARSVVPENLKSAVVKAYRFEHWLNLAYAARSAFIAAVSAWGMTSAAVVLCSGQTAPKM